MSNTAHVKSQLSNDFTISMYSAGVVSASFTTCLSTPFPHLVWMSPEVRWTCGCEHTHAHPSTSVCDACVHTCVSVCEFIFGQNLHICVHKYVCVHVGVFYPCVEQCVCVYRCVPHALAQTPHVGFRHFPSFQTASQNITLSPCIPIPPLPQTEFSSGLEAFARCSSVSRKQ